MGWPRLRLALLGVLGSAGTRRCWRMLDHRSSIWSSVGVAPEVALYGLSSRAGDCR